jgi:hypothetical protein
MDSSEAPTEAHRVLSTWTIYHNPLDYPGMWVLRRWDVIPGGGLRPHGQACICYSLEHARAGVPEGLVCFPRNEADDPAIFETWI